MRVVSSVKGAGQTCLDVDQHSASQSGPGTLVRRTDVDTVDLMFTIVAC